MLAFSQSSYMERLKTHLLCNPAYTFDDSYYYARNGWVMDKDGGGAGNMKCTICNNVIKRPTTSFKDLSYYPFEGHLSNCPWLLCPSPPDIRYQFSSFLPRKPANIPHIHSKFLGHWVDDGGCGEDGGNIRCVHGCSTYPKAGVVGEFDTLKSHHYYCPLMQAKKFIED